MGSGSSRFPDDKHIVIVGGGYGGSALAHGLKKEGANFTLIDVKDCFYHNVASVRATSEEGWIDKLYIPYEKTFGKHFKQGKVVSIDTAGKQVVLASGESINYDVLVIATGSSGDLPFKMGVDVTIDDVKELCKSTLGKLRAAKSVAVIGGGPVGVEVAGEIATDYKDKTVTLIHSSEKLISNEGFTDKFHKQLKDKLKNKGVTLILGEKVKNLPDTSISGPSEIITDQGTKVQADLVYKCIGVKTNTEAYGSALKSSMEANGQLKVNQHLQVEGQQEIFAIGDTTNIKEFKMGYRAGEHVKVLIKNIKAFLAEQPMQVYDPAWPLFAMAISVGRDDAAAATVGGWSVPATAMVWYKANDLMTSRFWGEFQQKMEN